jgi:8-oxo-dGTP diphosphatase
MASDPSPDRPYIGVGVLLWRDRQLLLGERVMQDGSHCWQFPGGHIEAGESVSRCAVRELREETGIEMSPPVQIAFTDKPFRVSGRRYITLFVSGQCPHGVEAENPEPGKCRGWKWFHYDQLPASLFEPVLILLDQLKADDIDLYALCHRDSGGRESP